MSSTIISSVKDVSAIIAVLAALAGLVGSVRALRRESHLRMQLEWIGKVQDAERNPGMQELLARDRSSMLEDWHVLYSHPLKAKDLTTTLLLLPVCVLAVAVPAMTFGGEIRAEPLSPGYSQAIWEVIVTHVAVAMGAMSILTFSIFVDISGLRERSRERLRLRAARLRIEEIDWSLWAFRRFNRRLRWESFKWAWFTSCMVVGVAQVSGSMRNPSASEAEIPGVLGLFFILVVSWALPLSMSSVVSGVRGVDLDKATQALEREATEEAIGDLETLRPALKADEGVRE